MDLQTNEFGPLFDTLLADARNPASLTFTDVSEGSLIGLLDDAVEAAARHKSALSEIQLDRQRFPFVGAKFAQVPVTASGDPAILRLKYSPEVSV